VGIILGDVYSLTIPTKPATVSLALQHHHYIFICYYLTAKYIVAMQAALVPFQEAYATGLAQPVADFLSPIPPAHDPGRLYDFYRASNDDKIDGEVRYALRYNKRSRMSQKESDAWIDIIAGYWRAVKQIILADEAANQGRLGDRQYLAVYDTWKDLTSSFIKHISGGALPAWAIFTLYFTANHLRKIAIKADEYLAKSKPATSINSFSDDIVTQAARSEKLEEAARVFNRVFALCLGDRCANTHSNFLFSSLTQAQKPRSVRVPQVGCLLYSQSSIQDVLQGTTSRHSNTMLCADANGCS
jgi:hypothetical protein